MKSGTHEVSTPLMDEDEHEEYILNNFKLWKRRHGSLMEQFLATHSPCVKVVGFATLSVLAVLAVLTLTLIWKINWDIYVSRHDCRLRSDAFFGNSKDIQLCLSNSFLQSAKIPHSPLENGRSGTG